MISFFRKIRHKKLTKSKFGKYLLYAIGEIILVVIGILIALQINNWNNDNINQKKEAAYFKNLSRDLNDQLVSIDNQIAHETRYTDAANYLITYFNHRSFTDLDSIFFTKLSELHSRKTFVINDPTYTDLLSSGNIGLIRSKDFRDELIQYYHELERIEKVIQNNNSFLVDEQFGDRFIDMGYFYSNLPTEKTSQIDQVESPERISSYDPELSKISEELLNNPEKKLSLINMLNMRLAVSLYHLGLMQVSRENTLKLIGEIKLTQ